MPRSPALLLLLALAACGDNYSPDTYATRAVQQANKAERGVVIGVRPVEIRADGTTGATAGAAAGAAAGSQIGGGGVANAFSAIGGGLIGGLIGTATERTAGDTKAFEYIVRNGKNELVSVVQKDETPLALGQRVLVIAGAQARIVPDYTADPPEAPGPNLSNGAASPAPPAAAATGASAPAPGDASAAPPGGTPATGSPTSPNAPLAGGISTTPLAAPATATPPAAAAAAPPNPGPPPETPPPPPGG